VSADGVIGGSGNATEIFKHGVERLAGLNGEERL
jgi:hypothetical protein